jgi:hypothetical protein
MTFEEFDSHMYNWSQETMFHSTYHLIAKHPSYEKIVEYAETSAERKNDVIGFTCLLLTSNYIHNCFIILGRLVDNPPPFNEYYAGRIPVMRECWRYWALKENIVFNKHDVRSYWVEDKHGNKGKWH